MMGVSGSGKTTIGRLLAEQLRWQFLDGDDYHPAANKEKMRRGIPLTDSDRADWLATLALVIDDHLKREENLVLACSALKQSYRHILSAGDARVQFVFLKGDQDLIAARMRARPGHYMKASLLASQFATLEEPSDALVVDVTLPPEQIMRLVRMYFQLT